MCCRPANLAELPLVRGIRPPCPTPLPDPQNASMLARPLLRPRLRTGPPPMRRRQASNFGMGGWWLGGTHMKPNQQFMPEVLASLPRDAKVIVGCQKGLR